jgi:hypothetical protein
MEQEPTVIVVLSPKGLEKAFVLYQEDDVDALEAGNLLLARISPQLALVDNALRQPDLVDHGTV